MNLFRSAIRSLAHSAPLVHRSLRSLYRMLPTSIRGRRMVYDHLRTVVRQGKDQTFVLVGANDGMFTDHVYDFARRYRWHGVAIEPVPAYFLQLEHNYGSLPVACVNKAVHRTERSMPFYYLDDSVTGVPEWAQGVGSFDRSQVERSLSEIHGAANSIQQIEVPCAPLSEIVAAAGLDRVDIFVIDVEGYDHEIVKQIDLNAWKPHTIVFEYKNISTSDLQEVCDLLVGAGYHLERDHEDILATRPAG